MDKSSAFSNDSQIKTARPIFLKFWLVLINRCTTTFHQFYWRELPSSRLERNRFISSSYCCSPIPKNIINLFTIIHFTITISSCYTYIYTICRRCCNHAFNLNWQLKQHKCMRKIMQRVRAARPYNRLHTHNSSNTISFQMHHNKPAATLYTMRL